MVNATMLSMLRDEYLAAQETKKEKRREINERHRATIAEEIAVMEDAVDTRMGEMLVRALGSGVKRAEIWKPVFGTNDNNRWSRLVRLGGGETRARRTGDEIVRDRINKLGVRREGDQFIWTLGSDNVECQLIWRNGRPSLWPIGDEALLTLRDGHGITLRDMGAKGAEVAAEFGITEGAKK